VGDALWWGIVTLTTVGYGDIVPKTPTGRWAAVTIMITGVAVLGVLAGSLASFFRLDNGTSSAESPTGEPTDNTAPPQDAALRALATEVSALRQQVETLTAQLTGTLPALAPQEPAGDEDAPGL
jgi:voltage-gated potassium channel